MVALQLFMELKSNTANHSATFVFLSTLTAFTAYYVHSMVIMGRAGFGVCSELVSSTPLGV